MAQSEFSEENFNFTQKLVPWATSLPSSGSELSRKRWDFRTWKFWFTFWRSLDMLTAATAAQFCRLSAMQCWVLKLSSAMCSRTSLQSRRSSRRCTRSLTRLLRRIACINAQEVRKLCYFYICGESCWSSFLSSHSQRSSPDEEQAPRPVIRWLWIDGNDDRHGIFAGTRDGKVLRISWHLLWHMQQRQGAVRFRFQEMPLQVLWYFRENLGGWNAHQGLQSGK